MLKMGKKAFEIERYKKGKVGRIYGGYLGNEECDSFTMLVSFVIPIVNH